MFTMPAKKRLRECCPSVLKLYEEGDVGNEQRSGMYARVDDDVDSPLEEVPENGR